MLAAACRRPLRWRGGMTTLFARSRVGVGRRIRTAASVAFRNLHAGAASSWRANPPPPLFVPTALRGPELSPRPSGPELVTHFTDEPSRLDAQEDLLGGVFFLKGGGFLTDAMVEDAVGQLVRQRPPERVLIDLRDVAGYDSRAVQRARHWLHQAPAFGVRRIAFLANSSIVRHATRLASTAADVRLETFDCDRSARDWLRG